MRALKFCLGVFLIVVAGLYFWNLFGNAFSHQDSRHLTAEGIHRIHVSSDVAEVVVLPTTGHEITVDFTGPAHSNLRNSTEGEQLNLSVKTRHHWFNAGNTPTLEIYVPAEQLESLVIESDVGTIQVEGITVDNLELTSRVGEVNLRDVVTASTFIQSNIGQVQVRRLTGNLNITTDMGEVDVVLPKLSQNVDIQTRMGEINVELGEMPTDATIIATTNVGESHIFGHLSQLETYGDGTYRMNLSTNMGEINVR